MPILQQRRVFVRVARTPQLLAKHRGESSTSDDVADASSKYSRLRAVQTILVSRSDAEFWR
jgi:hypothetical protein